MVNRIETVYPHGLNKEFDVVPQVWYETLEEGRRTYQPKHCEYNNKDKVNSLNILRNNDFIFVRKYF